jgi:SPP1 gp7 family putative phage head morphogenesis protein
LLEFDELTAIQSIKSLYEQLDDDVRKALLLLAKTEYKRADPHGEDGIDEDWLEDYLFGYSVITKYSYENEVTRKRDYLTEAVIASNTKKQEYRKALSRWSGMAAEYALEISDAAVLKAYKDAGVKKVKWNAEHDEKTCDECLKKDGKIYPIDSAPPKEHWNCRCWYTAVVEE